MRVTGLTTGMDIDNIVSNLMKARRAPLDKLKQQKQMLEWKRDDYKQLNIKIINFRNKLFEYTKPSSFMAKKAEVTGSNTSAISVKASTSSNAAFSIKVDKLATATTVHSNGELKSASSDPITSKTKLSDLLIDNGDGTTSTPGSAATFKIGTKVNDKGEKEDVTISFDPSVETIGDFVKKINGNKDSQVTAIFDDTSKKLILTNKETGNSDIQFTPADPKEAGEELLKALKLDYSGSNYKKGENAEVQINGVKMEKPGNTFVLNGTEVTLNGVTTEVLQVNVKTDTDQIMDTIKSFIKDYNELSAAIDVKLGEEKYRDFPPLTDEQRKEMKEDDIKRWEEKAKSGLLRNDDIMNGAKQIMREASITQYTIDGKSVSLTSLGIETGKWYEGGKLYLKDEEKLREAIEKDPEKVMAMFVGDGTKEHPGVLNKMYDGLKGTLDQLAEKAGTSKYSASPDAKFDESRDSVIGKSLRDYTNRVKELEKKMKEMENRYYNQFAAMENAINKFNAQSAQLMNFGQ
jgi:flagellar hook-associated protein 2